MGCMCCLALHLLRPAGVWPLSWLGEGECNGVLFGDASNPPSHTSRPAPSPSLPLDNAPCAVQVSKYQTMQSLRAVRSMQAAVNMVRINALTRGAHASVGSGNVIYDTFRWALAMHALNASKLKLLATSLGCLLNAP